MALARNAIRLALALGFAAVALVPAAQAHTVAYNTGIPEGYQVRFVYGLLYEPVSTFQKSGLDLGVFDSAGHPIVGLDGVDENGQPLANPPLHAQLLTGSSTLDMTSGLKAQDGRPGWYSFPVIFTKTGNYALKLQGTVNNTHVDQTIEPSHQVTDGSKDMWPVRISTEDTQTSDIAKLKSDLAAAQARLDALETKKSPGLDFSGMVVLGVCILGMAAARRPQ